MKFDVAIVGAGPAGLTAATCVARSGLSVVVLDEYYRPGGRLLGQIYEDRRKPAGQREWNGQAFAAALEAQLREAGGRILPGQTVWDIEAGWTLHLAPGPDRELTARAVIIATGAMERAVPVPGWTLPGVMTIGAAQVLTNVHNIAPGERVLVVGMDALSLSITGEMIAAGVEVVGVVLPPPGAFAGDLGVPKEVIGELSRAAALAPNLALRLGGHVFGGALRGVAAHLARVEVLRAWGVPLRLRTSVIEIIGRERVEAAVLCRVDASGRLGDKSDTVSVDAVCISGGLSPLSDLVRIAGAPVVEVPQLGGIVPVHGPRLETRVPGLFLAGNVIGVEGAAVAAAQGSVAAIGAMRYLGVIQNDEAERALAEAQNDVVRARRSQAFQFLPKVEEGHRYVDAIWRDERPLRSTPISFGLVGPPALTVCRCEGVSLAEVLGAFDDGATAVAGVKKRTRACMGRCQGRVCEDVLLRLALSRGQPNLLRHRPRVPARPVRMSEF